MPQVEFVCYAFQSRGFMSKKYEKWHFMLTGLKNYGRQLFKELFETMWMTVPYHASTDFAIIISWWDKFLSVSESSSHVATTVTCRTTLVPRSDWMSAT